MRAVVWEYGRNQRVGDCFQGSVRIGKNKASPEQHRVCVAWPGGESYERRENVSDESEDNELAVPDLVNDHATDDDPKAESRESGSGD